MFLRAVMVAAACMAGSGQPEPAAQPASDLGARLAQVDERAAAIEDLTATFEQRKHTALLREPMVSSGTVRVRAGRVLWETRRPRPSTLAIEEDRAIVLYPRQKAAEVYPLRAEMRLLGASPLPSFARLREAFEIAEADAADLVERPGADWIGLALTPKPGPMRDHIERVRALLDPQTPAVVALEITDADGDRTVIRFTEVRTNTGLQEADVTLKLGEDIEISYPLGRPEEAGEQRSGAATKGRNAEGAEQQRRTQSFHPQMATDWHRCVGAPAAPTAPPSQSPGQRPGFTAANHPSPERASQRKSAPTARALPFRGAERAEGRRVLRDQERGAGAGGERLP